MSKRFTDTTKWTGNKWFRTLPPHYKLFWFYILDTCDNVGVWEADFELASFLLGQKIDEAEARKLFTEQIEIFNGKKWWILKFIPFQYGTLDENIRPHKTFIEKLKQYGLWEHYQDTLSIGYKYSMNRDKDKDKDKDKEEDIKDKKEDCKGERKEKVITPIQQVVEHYKKVGKFENVPNWDKTYFPRCTKSAKQLLDLSGGDIEQAKQAITEIIGYLQGEGLSWTLETVVKQFGHWQSGKLIPSKDRRLVGNMEAGRKFIERGQSGE